MKFTCYVDINLPVTKVIELFDNIENLNKWQDGFIRMEHLSGVPGEVGSKSEMHYKTGNREMIITETITVKNLPQEMSGLYEHKHMVNTMKNRFEALSESETRYEVEIEYTKFIGFIPKVMARLFPGLFKKQVQKWLDQFKAFAEAGNDQEAR